MNTQQLFIYFTFRNTSLVIEKNVNIYRHLLIANNTLIGSNNNYLLSTYKTLL